MTTQHFSNNDRSFINDKSQCCHTGTSLEDKDTVLFLLSQNESPCTIARRLREITIDSFIHLSQKQMITQEEHLIPINKIRRFFLDKPPSDLEEVLNKSERELTSANFALVDLVRLVTGYIICLTGLLLVAYGIFTILSNKSAASDIGTSHHLSFSDFFTIAVGISYVAVGIFVIRARRIITPLLYNSIKRKIVCSITEETIVRWSNDQLKQEKKG